MLVLSTPCLCGVGTVLVHGWRVVGTLLGCETACAVFSPLGLLALWLVVSGVGVLFVNCIVDASIL